MRTVQLQIKTKIKKIWVCNSNPLGLNPDIAKKSLNKQHSKGVQTHSCPKKQGDEMKLPKKFTSRSLNDEFGWSIN
jgi:hypothetical protein